MIGRPAWVVARWVRRAAWWVFVVVALVAGRVSWLDFGHRSAVTYHGSYLPLNGVEMSRAYSTSLEIDYGLSGGDGWTGPVTAVTAALVVVAAIVQAFLVRRGTTVTLATIAAAPFAAALVSFAVNGIGDITFHTSLVVLVILAAVAIQETGTALARPRRDP